MTLQYTYITILRTITNAVVNTVASQKNDTYICLSPPPTIVHTYSHCCCLDYYANNKQCIFETLLNSANLAVCCHIWQIWAFQSSSRPSGGVLCVLIISHLAQLSRTAGRWRALQRHSSSVWRQKPGGRTLPASMAGPTRAAVEKATDPRGWRKRKS